MNNRIGEKFTTKEGYSVLIVEYNNRRDVLIEFQDEYKARVHTTYGNCKKGEIKNPYHPTVCGVGYIGVGKYKSTIDGKITKEYQEWQAMLHRCFDKKVEEHRPTYKNAMVEEWLFNFQNYCSWRKENYYEIEGEKMCLDKDILCKHNKIYSRDTMIFVPERINVLFTRRQNDRGIYPIGVCVKHLKNIDRYQARCQTLDGRKNLGFYDTPEEAFIAYKTFKEQYIKQVADEYRDKIPDKLYKAMYSWEIDIDD